jgi:hypothetical protein
MVEDQRGDDSLVELAGRVMTARPFAFQDARRCRELRAP